MVLEVTKEGLFAKPEPDVNMEGALVRASFPGAKKSKKPLKSPQKVCSPPDVLQGMSSEVRPGGDLGLLTGFLECGPSKLVVLNVHGTLVDSSMLGSPNPNSRICQSKATTLRRIFFRPWLKSFLSRCF